LEPSDFQTAKGGSESFDDDIEADETDAKNKDKSRTLTYLS